MPSSATITTFNTFVAGTKARASQVNENFSNFRGHSLPIDPNTATAVDATYDLGASDRRWRNIYLVNAPFIGGVQLSQFEIETVFDGSNPADIIDEIHHLGRAGFPDAAAKSVRFQFVVPGEYSAGNRISLNIKGFCQTGPSHITMETVSTLYRATLDNAALTLPSNRLTSTSNVSTPTTSGLVFSDTSLRLTDSSGRINSVTVTAGNIISVDLKRVGTATADTNTGYFYLTNVIVDLNN